MLKSIPFQPWTSTMNKKLHDLENQGQIFHKWHLENMAWDISDTCLICQPQSPSISSRTRPWLYQPLSHWINCRDWFLAHETAQTHRKSSFRSFDPRRRSSTGYSCAPSKSKQSNAALIVSIVLLRHWSWRHNTNAIFPATSKLRLAVIAVALHSWTSCDKHTTWSGYEKQSQVTHLHLIL